MYFPFSSNKKARGRLLLTTVKFIFMEPNGQWQKWYKTIKCTFYLNEKCNLEVTSIITIILPFYRQQGLASCMLRGAFLEHYFCQYIILQLCSSYVTNVHAASLHCFIYTVYSVPILTWQSVWWWYKLIMIEALLIHPLHTFLNELINYLQEMTGHFSLIGLGTALVIFLIYFIYYHYNYQW